MKHITVLKGDGIGPEVTNQALKVLESIAHVYNHEFIFDNKLIGAAAIDATGNPLPEETLKSCLSSDAVILGAIGDPKYDNDPKLLVRPEQGLLALRKALDLYANVRPIKIFKDLKHLSVLKPHILDDVDMVIYRELTGGIYFGEKNRTKDSASDLCIYSNYEIKRIARLAFKEAQKRRKKLCLIDKANVLESSRLWRDNIIKMAEEYPEVTVDFLFIDNAAMQMILNPLQFDVIVTSNMFGDIISDLASVLGGSLGMLPSSSAGYEYRLYEPVHGSYPQAAGKNIANPFAAILSIELMLRDFGLIKEADNVMGAVEKCINDGFVTSDISKSLAMQCSEVGHEVVKNIYSEKNINYGVII
ncbi:MAG: 3-isopropylmalate dehydrogenase [Saprospiraceae bacterium]|nr:3-isopropylmalate dehydrogenase [Saprospiraceae bacterium]